MAESGEKGALHRQATSAVAGLRAKPDSTRFDMKALGGFWRFRGFLLGVALLGFFSNVAHAQEAAGRFTLLHEAHWGTLVLPAGSYFISVDSASAPSRVMVRGEAKGAPSGVFLSSYSDETKFSATSKLTLVRQGDDLVVQSFTVGWLGRAFNFVPEKRNLHVADQPASKTLVAAASAH
jgi:hypothetical protein